MILLISVVREVGAGVDLLSYDSFCGAVYADLLPLFIGSFRQIEDSIALYFYVCCIFLEW